MYEQRADQPLPPDFPPALYLPCAAQESDPAELKIEMRRTRDGRWALLAYTALDRLLDGCGREQPWCLMPTANLGAVQRVDHFDLLLLDVVIPPEERHGAVTAVSR